MSVWDEVQAELLLLRLERRTIYCEPDAVARVEALVGEYGQAGRLRVKAARHLPPGTVLVVADALLDDIDFAPTPRWGEPSPWWAEQALVAEVADPRDFLRITGL